MYPLLQDRDGPHMGEGKFGADKVCVSSSTQYSEEVLENHCVVGHVTT